MSQAAPAAPFASLSEKSVSFAPATVGAAAPASIVTLTNTGGAPLLLNSFILSDTTDFKLTTTCATALPVGGSCNFAVQFTPQTAAVLSGTLILTDNSSGTAGTKQVITLSGMGTPVPVPQAVLTPASLSFGTAVLHTTAAAQTVILNNSGTAPLDISSTVLSDTADFSLGAPTCGAYLQPAANCTISVSFSPQTMGSLTSTLTFTDNSGLTTGTVQQMIVLSGTGLPAPVAKAVLTPVIGAFGNVNVGGASTAQTFTLLNSGNADLQIGSIVLSDTKNYALTNGCGSTLAAAASCNLGIVFQPQSADALNAQLAIVDNSNGQAGAHQSLSLTGTGLTLPSPTALLTPAVLTFPDTMQSLSAASQTVTLANTGNAGLILSGIALSDTQDFTLSSNCPATLAPATRCTLSIGFQPKTVAAFQATLTIADHSGSTDSSGASTAQQTVAITAEGTAFEEPRAAASSVVLTFPQTVTNSSSAAQAITLTNTGTQLLTVANVALGGPSAAAFRITSGNCMGSVAAGASCTESIIYSPTLGSTADAASLTFTDDALGQAGSTQVVALSGSAVAEVDSVENFGDSITCGFYAMPNDGTGLVWSLEGYAGLLDTFLGIPAQNWCRQGDTAADLSRLWVPFHSTPTSTGNQLFTMMIGTNDAYRYGIPQVALQTYTAEVAAAVSWLAIPNSDKVLANAITQRRGTWSQDVGFGMISTDAGASLTFPVNQAVAGRNLYVIYHVWALPYGHAGKASIAVDGTVQATVDESQNSGVYIPTENGTYDTFLAQAVSVGAVGPHTVTFTSVGPAGSAVGLLWAGVAQQDYRKVDGAPEVLLSYVPNSPSGNQTFAADNYSLQLRSLIPTLTEDGMNVKAVNNSRVMDPNTDFADILHPNNSGHAKLAAAFEQAK